MMFPLAYKPFDILPLLPSSNLGLLDLVRPARFDPGHPFLQCESLHDQSHILHCELFDIDHVDIPCDCLHRWHHHAVRACLERLRCEYP